MTQPVILTIRNEASTLFESIDNLEIPHQHDMHILDVLEKAYGQADANGNQIEQLVTRYYGEKMGYLVIMINSVWEGYSLIKEPAMDQAETRYMYWGLKVNGQHVETNIKTLNINPGDHILFEFIADVANSGDMPSSRHP